MPVPQPVCSVTEYHPAAASKPAEDPLNMDQMFSVGHQCSHLLAPTALHTIPGMRTSHNQVRLNDKYNMLTFFGAHV
jgi:hypothetical protein